VYETLTRDGANQVVYLPRARDSNGLRQDPLYHFDPPRDPLPQRGGDHADVTIVWFGEYESLASARVSTALTTIERAHAGRVRIIWRDLPPNGRSESLSIAEAAREVFAQLGNDGFWQFHASMMANQRSQSRSDLERYALSLHVNLDRLRSAVSEHSHRAAIEHDRETLEDMGITADAPIVFVNGRMFTGAALTQTALEDALNSALD
jgi:protein-disulfide isomerase